jgi:trans-aconitate methyltransferase
MIEAARSNCPDLTFLCEDIVTFLPERRQFDMILLMGNVLDCLHPLSRRSIMLNKCIELLIPGGIVIGSSHLRTSEQSAGYHEEEYHGAAIQNFRSSLDELVQEIESHGYEVMLVVRDYRDLTADWCYWVARSPLDLQKSMQPGD